MFQKVKMFLFFLKFNWFKCTSLEMHFIPQNHLTLVAICLNLRHKYFIKLTASSPSCIDPFTKKKKKKNSNNRLQSLIIHIQTHMTGQRPKQTGLSES